MVYFTLVLVSVTWIQLVAKLHLFSPASNNDESGNIESTMSTLNAASEIATYKQFSYRLGVCDLELHRSRDATRLFHQPLANTIIVSDIECPCDSRWSQFDSNADHVSVSTVVPNYRCKSTECGTASEVSAFHTLRQKQHRENSH